MLKQGREEANGTKDAILDKFGETLKKCKIKMPLKSKFGHFSDRPKNIQTSFPESPRKLNRIIRGGQNFQQGDVIVVVLNIRGGRGDNSLNHVNK